MNKVRTIDAKIITRAVSDLCKQANYFVPKDLYFALDKCRQKEASPLASSMLDDLLKNAEIAAEEHIPICQDTGTVVIFIDFGQDVHVINGDFEEAVNQGIAIGYTENYLRKSVVADPVFERKNTGNNCPTIIHLKIVAGDKIKILLCPKGGGAENKSKLFMLTPAHGLAKIKEVVVQTVIEARADACPPLVVGVGIGGNMEQVCLCAKRAAVRSVQSSNVDWRYAVLEQELLDLINKTNVGVQGLGGSNTALKVNIEWLPVHIASLPVAINLNCHAARHAELIL